MADDSSDIQEKIPYHPMDTPRGCNYYDFSVLTESQQSHLNDFKADLIRNDEKYLAKNLEIRAIVALVYRYLLKHKPKRDLIQSIATFFNRPVDELRTEIQDYVTKKNKETALYDYDYNHDWQMPEDYDSLYTVDEPYDTTRSIIKFIEKKADIDEASEDNGSGSIAFIRGILEGVIQKFPSTGNDYNIRIVSALTSGSTASSMLNIYNFDDEDKIENYIISGQDGQGEFLEYFQ